MVDKVERENKHLLLSPSLRPFTGIKLGSCFEKKISPERDNRVPFIVDEVFELINAKRS